MAISHDPPSVLIGPGDFHTGPYYIIISGLPERTSWQDVKDFVKSQIPWKLDIYVSIFGKRQDSGWVRVIGFKAFNHVRRVLGESLFRGREILAHNPGYDESGTGLVLVRAPFFRDRSLFINPEALTDPTTPSAAGSVQAVKGEYTITATTIPTASNAPSERSYSGQPQIHTAPSGVQFPPTPPNTPKASRSISDPSLSSSGKLSPSRFRKLAITWRREDEQADPTPSSSAVLLSPSTQEKMGSQIKAELTTILSSSSSGAGAGGSAGGLADPLETLECFPGVALATFSSHELARKAIKVLRQSDLLNARPVIDEISPPAELTEKGKNKRAGGSSKRGAGAGAGGGRTVSAPVATAAEPGVVSLSDAFHKQTNGNQGQDKETSPTLTTSTSALTTPAAATPKTSRVLVVNGSWKI
ncbi:hypothetical protein B0T20DRAFT_481111 [Sordaria brevicollis]|uniref:Uncharacterized protein n=1 Tax=Sordaria brevicollis TaxID=83679 RepID=A0AAE0PA43_SORBR|nr:hypothetical protein B0T20DRAFT_481111 [Sordaria brevicollis]